MTSPESTDASFERDVKPLFRDTDRESMLEEFDLWSFSDVNEHAEDILRVLEDGSMPCDEPWPADRIQIFRTWVESGSLP